MVFHADKLSSGQSGLVGVDGPLSRHFVFDNRGYIIGGAPFGHPTLDIQTFAVEFLHLAFGVEHPEIGGSIATTARCPLPPTDVGSQFVIQELLREIALTPAPIDQQVFAQKAGHHHAHPVVHESSGIEFTHSRIDQRVSGASCAPCFKSFFVMPPGDAVVFGPECIAGTVGEVVENGLVEFPPNELRQPFVAVLHPKTHQRADGDGSKPEVEAHSRGALDRRSVSRFGIILHRAGIERMVKMVRSKIKSTPKVIKNDQIPTQHLF